MKLPDCASIVLARANGHGFGLDDVFLVGTESQSPVASLPLTFSGRCTVLLAEECWKQPLKRDVGAAGFFDCKKKLDLGRSVVRAGMKTNQGGGTKHSLIKIVN